MSPEAKPWLGGGKCRVQAGVLCLVLGSRDAPPSPVLGPLLSPTLEPDLLRGSCSSALWFPHGLRCGVAICVSHFEKCLFRFCAHFLIRALLFL